jgi:membrane-associated phospholipid phosphatase
MELAERLHAGWFTDFSKVFTFLGSGVFTWSLTAVCAVLLIARRRWAEVGVLLAGMTLSSIGIHEIKDAVDRPRPDAALVSYSGSSYPSGHATRSSTSGWR